MTLPHSSLVETGNIVQTAGIANSITTLGSANVIVLDYEGANSVSAGQWITHHSHLPHW